VIRAKGKMTSFITENLSFYLALAVSIILCFYFSKKISKRNGSHFIRVTSKFLVFVTFVLVATGVFSWRVSQTASLELNFDTWLISLDISLAHFIFSFPIAIISYTLFSRVFRWIGQVLSNIHESLISALGIEKDLENLGVRSAKFLEKSQIATFFTFVALFIWAFFYDYTIPALSLITAYWTSKFLLVENNYLQTTIIGAFDSFLGWNYPTIFKFTVIVEHLQAVIQILVGKKEIATILSFLGLVSSGILGFAALIDAIDKIGKNSRK
jgi:hypothetical protein